MEITFSLFSSLRMIFSFTGAEGDIMVLEIYESNSVVYSDKTTTKQPKQYLRIKYQICILILKH